MNLKKITYELGLIRSRRKCPIKKAGIKEINYKDVEFLKEFITEKGKIIPKRISGISAKNQKKLAAAIKRARNIALLSFSDGYRADEDTSGQSSIYSLSTQSDIAVTDKRADDKAPTQNETPDAKSSDHAPTKNETPDAKSSDSAPTKNETLDVQQDGNADSTNGGAQ